VPRGYNLSVVTQKVGNRPQEACSVRKKCVYGEKFEYDEGH